MRISSLKRIEALISKFSKELGILMEKDSLLFLIYIDKYKPSSEAKIIKDLSIKFSERKIKKEIEKLVKGKFLARKNKNKISLTRKGVNLIFPIYLCEYQKKIENLPEDIIDGYKLIERVGMGATGVTYSAKTNTGKKIVIKIFRPKVIDEITLIKSFKKATDISSDYLVTPNRLGKFKLDDLTLNYIEMKFVDGMELNKFLDEALKREINYNVQSFVENFILEVGGTLEIMENKGLEHNDLHSSNILVTEDQFRERHYHFKVVDFAGMKTRKEMKKFELLDIDYFKENLMQIILASQISDVHGRMSLERMLGEKLFYIYSKVRKDEYKKFSEILYDLKNPLPLSKKLIFEEEPKHPFGYLIFEHYNVKEIEWLKRFYPKQRFLNELKKFENHVLSGPRGCGKSIYLRGLSFIPELISKIENHPDLKKKYVDYHSIFGIYIPGRSADYNIFSKRFIGRDFEYADCLLLKHIMITDIMERVCKLIGKAYTLKIFEGTQNWSKVFQFVERFLLRKPKIIGEANDFIEISKLLEGEKANLIRIFGEKEKYKNLGDLLTENSLIKFFGIINESVPELRGSRFYILFDDVSEPNVPFEAQHIVNSILRANNEKYCFKLSTEKYAFDFIDYNGKNLESPHDYTYLDIPKLGKETVDKESKVLEGYFRNLVNQQLKIQGINRDITSILDKNLKTSRQFVKNLSRNEPVQWGGWNIIWRLASGSARVLLQILDSILKEYGEEKIENLKNKDQTISLEIQNSAILKFSKREYANIINIGHYGGKLFSAVRVFGEISKRYLKRQITKKEGRYYETITIERMDFFELEKETQNILRGLLRHSIFVDEGLTFALSQIGLVPKFTLHKRFCPALGITYREREHVRLYKKQLDTLLCNPDRFLEMGTKYLREEYTMKTQSDLELFYKKDDNYENKNK